MKQRTRKNKETGLVISHSEKQGTLEVESNYNCITLDRADVRFLLEALQDWDDMGVLGEDDDVSTYSYTFPSSRYPR